MKKIILIILVVFIQIPTFSQKTSTFTDSRDGKTYKTVKIGDQFWMAENLAFKTDSGCWAYNNDQSNVAQYGYLYNWETAKSICPQGWHLPSKEEFETLIDNSGGSADAAYWSLIPGGSSGFSAPFGGFRINNGYSFYIGKSAYFWSSSPDTEGYSWSLFMYCYNLKASLNNNYLSCGFSVRCLKDN
jgi:uncharacterized protein (TIGR02145 family)